jgi:hypothetical protein
LHLDGEDNLHSRKVSFQSRLPRIRELVTQTTDGLPNRDHSMKPTLVLALVVFGLSSFLTQTLFASQVLAVSSNAKWDMQYDPYGNVNALAAKALAACNAKGGIDPKIVWSVGSSVGFTHPEMWHGSIAISDNGTGTILGWHVLHWSRLGRNTHGREEACQDCKKKGGQSPKVVASF